MSESLEKSLEQPKFGELSRFMLVRERYENDVQQNLYDHEEDNEVSVVDYEAMRASWFKKIGRIEEEYTAFLASIGCGLKTLEYETELTTDHFDVTYPDLVIVLEDGQKFVDFLRSIHPEVWDKNIEKRTEILVSLLEEFNESIYGSNDIEGSKDESYLEFIRQQVIDPLREELKRIGDSLPALAPKKQGDAVDLRGQTESIVKSLDRIKSASEGGYLFEYVEAHNFGLLDSPDLGNPAFLGPGSYADLDHMEEEWDEIINILQKIRTNPKASVLFDAVKPRVTEGLGLTIKKLEENPDKASKEFLDAFLSVRGKINKII